MIRIITESKQDWERLYQSFVKKCRRENRLDPERSARQLLDKYKSLRHLITDPDYKDVTRLAKSDITVFDLDKYLDNLDSKTAEKKFLKKFGGSAKRDFDGVKDDMSGRYLDEPTYRTWLSRSKAALYGALDGLGVSYDKQEFIDEGSELIYDKKHWKVYKITNWMASEFFGRGSGWCISGNYDGPADEFFGDGDVFYFYIKDNGELYCLEYNEKQPELSIVWDGTDEQDEPYGMPLWYLLPDDFPQIKKTFPKWISYAECVKIFKQNPDKFYGLNDMLDDNLNNNLGQYIDNEDECVDDDNETNIDANEYISKVMGTNAEPRCVVGEWSMYSTENYNGDERDILSKGFQYTFYCNKNGALYCLDKSKWLLWDMNVTPHIPYVAPLFFMLPDGMPTKMSYERCKSLFMDDPKKFYGINDDCDDMLDEVFGNIDDN